MQLKSVQKTIVNVFITTCEGVLDLILREVRKDYSSSHLNEVAEERLLTDEIKNKHDVESIELETTILKENYIAGKLLLTGMVCSRLKVNKPLISIYCLIK